MKERFLTRSAAILLLIRETAEGEELLLQRRENTGYMDGYYDLSASGHVEKGESMIKTLIREAKEEIGIDISEENIEFVTMMHTNNFATDQVYYNGFFKVTKYSGEVTLNEPTKCGELKWFKINELPQNILQDRFQAIKNYIDNVKYSEFGWKCNEVI